MYKQINWNRALIVAGLVVVIPGVVFLLFPLAAKAIWLRYFYVVACLLVVAGTIIHSFRKRDEVLAKQGTERNVFVARMKFRAEVMAAFALIVFIGPYYQIGLSLDKLAGNERSHYLNAASAIFKEHLPPEYCLSRPQLKKSCDTITQEIAALYKNVMQDTGEEVTKNIDGIIVQIKLLDLPAASAKANALDEGVSKLKVIDLKDGLLTYAFSLLPLVILLFASLAVSSKVGVAWAEVRVRLREQLVEKDEAEQEARRQKLEDEAGRAEQASA
ncbi:MAG: SdpI family protein [Burkholderiales bacterium]|jgi:hypothetical protein|uniref:SdpI family protein n=1 Tax=Janthinobacterium tructae TaxID=2590869 RepID=A0A4Y6RDB0_9BURK|nr:SdpI family protein [Janthinobacterium tructae]MBH1984067.1 SdpI family protein [Burkholderiales bacterium]MBH1994401.1 SdpI family protein [Burkholderiales bacterium]MBH2069268.1 SdpI family protein [Burkholderiales bacterium]QDG70941.1 SdpI family protein [Janthinobacterium tructae]